MRLNENATYPYTTHEGAQAHPMNLKQALTRSVMSCMLWEDSFYEEGEKIGNRIANLVGWNKPEDVSEIAIRARIEFKLRHVPLLLVREMCRYPTHRKLVRFTLERVIQRPDEICEFLAIYWSEGKRPIPAQVKKALGSAFNSFTEYQLGKWNQDRKIKLRDALFLCHAKPKDEATAELFKKLVEGKLETPDTWEVELSQSKDPRASWTRLLDEKKLGGLALLRNLRNMTQAGVERDLIKAALTTMNTERVLPFRFISAAKHAPDFEPALETAMFSCLQNMPRLHGATCLLVDVSGSMIGSVSGKSDIDRLDAACGLAMLLREICYEVKVFTFSNHLMGVPPRRGFALRDAIHQSQMHGGTELGSALTKLSKDPFDRMIVITDEQSHDRVMDPVWKKNYMINVAPYQQGVGYGKWTHIDGWSEAIVSYIQSYESFDKNNR